MQRLFLAGLLLFASQVAAQQAAASLHTAGPFGVRAVGRNQQNAHVLPGNTAVAPSLSVQAQVGSALTGAASAQTQVQLLPTTSLLTLAAVRVAESGHAGMSTAPTPANPGFAAGTVGAAVTTPVGFGAHALVLRVPLPAGRPAVVHVSFDGNASTGASAVAGVDVDGDGVDDFAAQANGQPQHAMLPVTGGTTGGLLIRITTRAHCAVGQTVGGPNHAAYNASLVVRVERAGSTGCDLQTIGTPCGAVLQGALQPQPTGGATLQLQVDQAAPNAFGALGVGSLLQPPVALPFSSCVLLVNTGNGGFLAFQTDAAGAATLSVPVPPHLQTLTGLQAIVLRSTATTLFALDASNGLRLRCQ
jgi:hypothetical protein